MRQGVMWASDAHAGSFSPLPYGSGWCQAEVELERATHSRPLQGALGIPLDMLLHSLWQEKAATSPYMQSIHGEHLLDLSKICCACTSKSAMTSMLHLGSVPHFSASTGTKSGSLCHHGCPEASPGPEDLPTPPLAGPGSSSLLSSISMGRICRACVPACRQKASCRCDTAGLEWLLPRIHSDSAAVAQHARLL